MRNFETHFYADIDTNSTHFTLSLEESRHALKVFRMNIDDELLVSNGNGLLIHARIDEIKDDLCYLQKINLLEHPQKQPEISLAIGIIREKDLEELVEGLCQFSLKEIILIKTDHSQENAKASHKKLLSRLEKKSLTGLKQAKKTWQTKIHPPISFKKWFEQNTNPIVLCDEKGELRPNLPVGPLTLAIGPEGGFSQREIDILTPKSDLLSLGPTRLRAKTAPLAALGVIFSMR